MKVPYKWLKRYVDLDIDANELARRFTLAGLEVDDVEEFAAGIEGVVVAAGEFVHYSLIGALI